MHANVLRRLDQPADRRERLEWIVTDVGMHGRSSGQRAARRDEDGVAVGIGAGDHLGADAAAGAAAAVLDHDALTEHGAKPIRDDARHAVGRSARRERHDHLDRTIGIGLGVREISAKKRPAQRPSDAQRDGKQRSDHRGLPAVPAT
jgi:hypothetical protein